MVYVSLKAPLERHVSKVLTVKGNTEYDLYWEHGEQIISFKRSPYENRKYFEGHSIEKIRQYASLL